MRKYIVIADGIISIPLVIIGMVAAFIYFSVKVGWRIYIKFLSD